MTSITFSDRSRTVRETISTIDRESETLAPELGSLNQFHGNRPHRPEAGPQSKATASAKSSAKAQLPSLKGELSGFVHGAGNRN